jgi:hypothetical protein
MLSKVTCIIFARMEGTFIFPLLRFSVVWVFLNLNKFIIHFRRFMPKFALLCYGVANEKVRNMFQGQNPQGCPNTTKLGNKSGNSQIYYITRLCANTSVHHDKNGSLCKEKRY